jgi:UDP-glucose:(galactosyl)LPS alpha-1,2-glucosyltransferase
MNIVPVVFAFDNNLILPACVCISSLMMNAKEDTFYDIFILHSANIALKKEELDKLSQYYQNCRIQYRQVDNTFDSAFEIRGITTSTYYRLLIPDLIPEYDKIIYSDVDVIFRSDLSNIYFSVDLHDSYVAGVNALIPFIPDMRAYYQKMRKVEMKGIIYAGNIILNSKKIREDNIIEQFKKLAKKNFRFQDLDVLNIVCQNRVTYLKPEFCVTTYFSEFSIRNRTILRQYWTDNDIALALQNGIVHYNGQKPWKGFCVNFDIWWEYYRKSPFFDEKFYFEFFYKRLNELDQLSLWKRIKILIRYFVYGKREI